MTFTGYSLTRLQSATEHAPLGAAALLAATDLLLDGPFLRHKIDRSRPWVGSTNQGIHFLTDRYAHLRDVLSDGQDRLEIRIEPDGTTHINGWADIDAIDRLLTTGAKFEVKPELYHRPVS